MSVADNLSGVKVEVGFGADAVGGDFFVLDDPARGELDSATYLLAPDAVYVDATASVAAVRTGRGREREIDEYRTGTVTVVFNDNDRTFDNAYSGSPYYGQITPMRRIRITWDDLPIFQGWVDDWSVMYEPGDNLSRVTAECVDGFAILANQDLDTITPSFTGDTTGERIERVLDLAEVDFPPTRAIDEGITTLGDTTFGQNALSYLQACSRAEAGYLFIAADGTLTFRNRTATLNVPSDLAFSDDPTAGVPYLNVTQRSASDLLFTRVTAESETTSNPVEAVDLDGADEFRIRTLPLGTLFTVDDTQTQDLVDSYLERFHLPEDRFQTATINLAACTDAQVRSVVRLDLTDIVTVERSPLGIGSAIERLSIIDGIEHRIATGSWTVDLSFANADTRTFLVLDDSVFGDLDSNRLAF
jgi:hypothetical protein